MSFLACKIMENYLKKDIILGSQNAHPKHFHSFRIELKRCFTSSKDELGSSLGCMLIISIMTVLTVVNVYRFMYMSCECTFCIYVASY